MKVIDNDPGQISLSNPFVVTADCVMVQHYKDRQTGENTERENEIRRAKRELISIVEDLSDIKMQRKKI